LMEERGQGDLAAVARGVTMKLVRRHPHVFESSEALAELPTLARTPTQVRENWDAIKRMEPGGGEPLGAIPETLPGLLYARKVLRRTTGGGKSPSREDAAGRVRTALEEISGQGGGRADDGSEETHGSEADYELIGELLFAAVELARSLAVDPELALRRTADRFRATAGGV
jgi:uncharacterized protein YabN with tetrapyrrole methylase and pyrophosphatase domain